jgi:hypothetical protein
MKLLSGITVEKISIVVVKGLSPDLEKEDLQACLLF